jgi:hypothetical protein
MTNAKGLDLAAGDDPDARSSATTIATADRTAGWDGGRETLSR